MRDGVTFYSSFYEAIQELELGPAEKGAMYEAIIEYGLLGKEPEHLSGAEKAVFRVIKPVIDANIKAYENGKRGGRPAKDKVIESNKKKGGFNPGYENSKTNENDNNNENENNNNIAPTKFAKKNKFHNFEQRVIDYEALEKEVGWK